MRPHFCHIVATVQHDRVSSAAMASCLTPTSQQNENAAAAPRLGPGSPPCFNYRGHSLASGDALPTVQLACGVRWGFHLSAPCWHHSSAFGILNGLPLNQTGSNMFLELGIHGTVDGVCWCPLFAERANLTGRDVEVYCVSPRYPAFVQWRTRRRDRTISQLDTTATRHCPQAHHPFHCLA